MKRLFNLLFRGTIMFSRDTKYFVSVLNSAKRGDRSEDLCAGIITSANFYKRTLTIELTGESKLLKPSVTIKFDDIVTLSRMKDGRLRMWIKAGGVA